MDFVPSLVQGAGTFVGTSLSGATIVASTFSGGTVSNSTISGSTIIGGTLSGATFIGGTLSGTSLVNVTVNSGSTISVYALPTRQFVHVTRGGSDQSINENAYTQVNYTTQVFDAANVFNTSTDRMTPTIAGKYLVIASAGWDSLVDGDFVESIIYKNGASVTQGGANSTNDNVTAISVGYIDMNGTTDYLEHFVRHTNLATTARDLNGDTDRTYFMAMWMST